MARRTKLFQQARSPLIQGRSRLTRPWWQAYAVALFLGLMWPMLSSLPHEIAAAGREGLEDALTATFNAWVGGLFVLVPTVVVGAAIGVTLGDMWGSRLRWVPGTACAVGFYYVALVLIGLFAG